MPTIGAIIAFHRNEQFIEEALESVFMQTRPVDEIVLVNDASPSGADVLRRLPRSVRLIHHEHNTGIGGARQTGVEHSTSDVLAFLDGDDLWQPDKIARQLAFLEEHPDTDLVHTGTVTFLRDGTERPFVDRPPLLGFADQLRWNHVLIQTAMMPRETVVATGGFRASRRFVPDWDFSIRLLARGGIIRGMPEPLTRVRRWDHGNISSSGLRQMRRRIATILEHWPLVRRELGFRGGVESIAGIVEDEGGKVGHRLGGMWRGCAGVIRASVRWLPTAAVLLAACGGEGSANRSGAAITISTVDGVTTVAHTESALARASTVKPGALVQSIGGLDADLDHDATAMRSAWLLPDGFLTLQGRESTLRRYDSAGVVTARFGSRGEGPEEFLSLGVRRLTGDSLELLDDVRGTVRRIGVDLVPTPGRRFAEITSRTITPMATIDARLVAVQTDVDTSGAMSGPSFRLPVHVLRQRAASTPWDTVIGYRGPLLYPVRGLEGGQEFPAQRFVRFGPSPLITIWRDQIVVVDNDDWTIEVHDPDGALRIRTLTDWSRRPATAEMRAAELAADLANLDRWNAPPEAKAPYVAQARAQRFADSVAPYDRILSARDGSLWLRTNVTAIDTVEHQWLGFGRDGQLVRRLLLTAGTQLLDIDRDRVLLRRTDQDGIGYIEVRRLKEGAP